MTSLLEKDVEQILNVNFIDWNCFADRTILLTGATGLIGSNFVKLVAKISEKKHLNTKIICVVRNMNKAKSLFSESESVSFIYGDIEKPLKIEGNVDYIIHAANPTSSKFFIDCPVETINSSVLGTMNMLEFAKNQKVQGFVYLSTMEVYGEPRKDSIILEKDVAGFNTEKPRNCYPIAKQLCESLCAAYANEYGVPVRVLRLTQTFGPGVNYNDARVFAEFIRCAIEKKDIILKTMGETERSYLYTADAVTAILVAIQKGEGGACYSVANPDTYCSIMEMARLVAHDICECQIDVKTEIDDISKYGYANTLHMNLDVSKMKSLGWYPQVGLSEMFYRAILDLKQRIE